MRDIKIFLNKQVDSAVRESEILNIVKIARSIVKKITGEIEINIIGDELMKSLNKKYRKKNKTTDVLSFAWSEDGIIQSETLGQIYISLPQIKRQAKENRVKEKDEFNKILTHGLLHLAGYDHQTDMEEKKMRNIEKKIIENL
jgi:probable rRNA maturation factor